MVRAGRRGRDCLIGKKGADASYIMGMQGSQKATWRRGRGMAMFWIGQGGTGEKRGEGTDRGGVGQGGGGVFRISRNNKQRK